MDWLINAVYYVVPFVVVLGILVFVHELGLFPVPRWWGARVKVFSFGFGRDRGGGRESRGPS